MYRNFGSQFIGGGNPCNVEGVYVNNAMNRRLGRVGRPYVNVKGCSYTGHYQTTVRKGNPYSGEYARHYTGKRTGKKIKVARKRVLPQVQPTVSPKKAIVVEPENPEVLEINNDIAQLATICKRLTDPTQRGSIRPAEANIFINSIIRKYNLDTAKLKSGSSLKAITNNCGDLGDQLLGRKKLIRA